MAGKFSIAWKKRKNFFHGVEKSAGRACRPRSGKISIYRTDPSGDPSGGEGGVRRPSQEWIMDQERTGSWAVPPWRARMMWVEVLWRMYQLRLAAW